MIRSNPLRLLICSYGLSAIGAAALSAAGLGFAAAFGLFWIGGAVLVLALPFAPIVGRAFRAPPDHAERVDAEEEKALAAALRRWDEDIDADRQTAPARRAPATRS